MITVETILLVGLGFLFAGLIVLLAAPTYWARAVRVTNERVRASLPVSEAEIQAEHGRLRAAHALTIHALKGELERMKISASHRRVDVNRRDAQISELRDELEQLRTSLEISENARRVLEQTITDRVPDVERHLREAQRSLEHREAEVARLRVDAAKAHRALQEAIDISEQQRIEIAALNKDDGDRPKRRANGGVSAAALLDLDKLRRENAGLRQHVKGQDEKLKAMAERLAKLGEVNELEDEAELKALISEIETLADRAANEPSVRNAGEDELFSMLADRDRTISDLEGTIVALESDLKAVAGGAPVSNAAQRSTGDARVKSLEARLEAERARSRNLRSELTNANERLARQAAHYTEELRRLGRRRTTPPSGVSPSQPTASEKPLDEATAPARRLSLRARLSDELGTTSDDPVRTERIDTAGDGKSNGADNRDMAAADPNKAPEMPKSANGETVVDKSEKPEKTAAGPKGGLVERISSLNAADD